MKVYRLIILETIHSRNIRLFEAILWRLLKSELFAIPPISHILFQENRLLRRILIIDHVLHCGLFLRNIPIERIAPTSPFHGQSDWGQIISGRLFRLRAHQRHIPGGLQTWRKGSSCQNNHADDRCDDRYRTISWYVWAEFAETRSAFHSIQWFNRRRCCILSVHAVPVQLERNRIQYILNIFSDHKYSR